MKNYLFIISVQVIFVMYVLIHTPLYAQIQVNNDTIELYDKFEASIFIDSLASNVMLPWQKDLIHWHEDIELNPEANPYDYNKIKLEAIFTNSSSQKNYTVGGFLYQFFTIENTAQPADFGGVYLNIPRQDLIALDQYCWKVRFSPLTAGTWNYQIRFTFPDSSYDDILVCKDSFTCTLNQHRKGFLGLKDSTSFIFSNGESYVPLGMNITRFPADYGNDKSGTNYYEVFFRELHQYGGNFARIEIDIWHALSFFYFVPWNNNNHQSKYYNRFRQNRSLQLDMILDLAAKYDIRLKIVLFRELFKTDQWYISPFNVNNERGITGVGSCTELKEVMSDSSALNAQELLIKYLVDRYAYSSNIFAWEILNEADNVVYGSARNYDLDDGGFADYDEWWTLMYNWHRFITDEIKKSDIYSHPVTVSFGNFYLSEPSNSSPSKETFTEYWVNFNHNNYKNKLLAYLDFGSFHSYPRQKHTDSHEIWEMANDKDIYFEETQKSRTFFPDKPLIIGEASLFGLQGRIEMPVDYYLKYDPSAFSFHSSLWSSLMGGSNGPIHHWQRRLFIDTITNEGTAYMKAFEPINHFIKNIDYLDASRQESYKSSFYKLDCYYLSDKELKKVYGWLQHHDFSFDILMGTYLRYEGLFPNPHPYLTSSLDPAYKPNWLNSQEESWIKIKVPIPGTYEIKWYDSQTGYTFMDSLDYFSSLYNDLFIEISDKYKDSKYGDLAFTATWINDQQKEVAEETIFCFPNPAVVNCTVFSETPMKEIRIYNLLGDNVSTYDCYLQCSFEFNVEDLNPCVYIVNAELESGDFVSSSIIKLRN